MELNRINIKTYFLVAPEYSGGRFEWRESVSGELRGRQVRSRLLRCVSSLFQVAL